MPLMNTNNSGVPLCPLCSRELTVKLVDNVNRLGKKYNICVCKECGVGFTNPGLSPEESAGLYASGKYRVTSGKRFNPFVEFLIYLSRLGRKRRIGKYMKGGRILDIGCGRGLFLNIMRKNGWNVTGVESDKETASYVSNTYGIDVVAGSPSEWGFPDRSFDVITLSHVLEHIPDPAGMVGACRRLLKERGLLVVAVPNISSLQASVGKGAWFHLDVPYHLCHFSENGLSSLLRRNSFEILKVRRFDMEYNPFGWLQTLLNIAGIRTNMLYSLLKSPELRRKELADAKKKDLLLAFGLLPLYLPLSLALSLYESFVLKRGGTVEVFAVKE